MYQGKIHHSDLNEFGLVKISAIHDIFESARVAFLAEKKIFIEEVKRNEIIFYIIDASLHFSRALSKDQEFEIQTILTRIKPTRYLISQKLTSKNIEYVTAEITAAVLNAAGEIPKEIDKFFEPPITGQDFGINLL